MREPQRGLEHAQQRAARAARDRLVGRREVDLGELEVPVAVLVPDELVDCARGVVEAVLGEPLLDLGLRLGEGSGALAAVPLVRSAALLLRDVALLSEVLG